MLCTNNAVIILYGIRFPENVGMVARACANLGCHHLRLVRPERYDEFRAWPLATRIGYPILRDVQIYDELIEAVKDLYALYGTSARTGGRRQSISPACFAASVLENKKICEDGFFGILFGPEDRGLSNAELCLCQDIISIPALPGSSSFNIAQAVLIVLYELYRNNADERLRQNTKKSLNQIKIGDLQRLEGALKDLMLECSALPENNPDYFFARWHKMLSRLKLSRHEYDAIMGLCRRLKRKITT